MSRYCGDRDSKATLEAAEHWRQNGLLNDGSIFGEKSLWKLEYLKALDQYFIRQPDEGKRDFFKKLDTQLTPTGPEVKQVASEILWVMFLCQSNISQIVKREGIRKIWAWSEEPFPEDSIWLQDAYISGVGSAGTAYNTNRAREFAFAIRVVIALKQLVRSDRENLLKDGWGMAKWLEQIPECNSRQFRHMMLFLLFPDSFERIFGGADRRKIISATIGKSNAQINNLSALDVDRELSSIRQQQEKIYGVSEMDFYHPPLRDLWVDPIIDTGFSGAKNLILYGPPGTGKTYQTVNYALSIIENRGLSDLNSATHENSREELTGRFRRYKKNGQIEFITFHQNYAYEDFIQGLRPDVNRAGNGLSFEKKDGVFKNIVDRALEEYKAAKEKSKNYVLIIDEINRANISRVFGELITLIEEDKRFGQTNEIEATLPSGDPFCIPPNLYIIGTMNTADKSIALLDIALRRRFEFIKVYPVADLVDKQFRNLFEKLNLQIIKEKGPDFQIGHAYLMSKNGDTPDLKEIMNNKIIPLLYEYFMNDGKAVKDILTESGIEVEENYGLYEFGSYKNG